jgi:hypothetical protein
MVLGCTDVAAIRHLLMSDELQHAAATTIEIGALAAYERPLRGRWFPRVRTIPAGIEPTLGFCWRWSPSTSTSKNSRAALLVLQPGQLRSDTG